MTNFRIKAPPNISVTENKPLLCYHKDPSECNPFKGDPCYHIWTEHLTMTERSEQLMMSRSYAIRSVVCGFKDIFYNIIFEVEYIHLKSIITRIMLF